MTEMSRMPVPHEPGPTLTCDELTAQLSRYVDGTLPEAAARALEWHAAHCGVCEPVLNHVQPAPHRITATFTGAEAFTLSDVEAGALRHSILAQVERTRATSRQRRQWPLTVGALLAASLLLLVGRSPSNRRPATGPATTAEKRSTGGDSAWTAISGSTSASMQSALELARAQAAPEFAALDTAYREIERALAIAPSDAVLFEFRSAIEARRRELESRVARVTE